ncbi:MAG: DUF4118 domain-containing protein [Reyranella sp.]|nr:DUF4118 domain-containing protein [Reyranella sp.]
MDLFAKTQPLRKRPWIGYLFALAAPVGSLELRLAMDQLLDHSLFITFYPAVLVATYLGGWRPGVLAAVWSALLASYFLLGPPETLVFYGASEIVGIAFFAVVSTLIIALIHTMERARTRLASASEALGKANEALEWRVAERTYELLETNKALRQEIDTRETAEAQVRQTQKMEAVGRLTGGIAHDFNNMLAIVIGSLDLARRRLARGDGDVARLVDAALDGANRGAQLTRRLLAFSRQQALAPVVLDVSGLVQDMAELLRRVIGERVDLETVVGGGLWRVKADPGQLESAILNLAVNARDAMPEGGRLTIEARNAPLDDGNAARKAGVPGGQYVMVAVSDTGTGMSPEVAARAIDPFFTTKTVDRGSGLGLSQVYGFVSQSGGHLRIDSTPGRGTTVRIYLRRVIAPAAAAVDALGRLAAEAGRSAALPSGQPDEIILVVEDEDGVRRTTVAALRELGYTVLHAASADEARALLQAQPGIRLLFTDVVMPGTTGRQLVDAVKPRRPDLKVLYTTGYTRDAIVHDGEIDPGIDLLMKPFALDQLARKVRSMLDGETAS